MEHTTFLKLGIAFGAFTKARSAMIEAITEAAEDIGKPIEVNVFPDNFCNETHEYTLALNDEQQATLYDNEECNADDAFCEVSDLTANELYDILCSIKQKLNVATEIDIR